MAKQLRVGWIGAGAWVARWRSVSSPERVRYSSRIARASRLKRSANWALASLTTGRPRGL